MNEVITVIVALLVLGFLAFATLAFLQAKGLRTKQVTILFLVALLVFLSAAAFIHYRDLYPFGGGQGDQPYYHNAALLIANDINEGAFTWERAFNHLVLNDASKHTYPFFIGVLYAFTIPDQFVGKMVNVWAAALSILLIYFLARELGAKEKFALVAASFGIVYPSYLYFNSLLIRESIVAVLVLLGTLTMLKIMKEFSWSRYGMFFIFGFLLVHFRSYIGLVLLIAFGLSWLFFSRMEFKTRMAYAAILIPLLGFIPQAFGHGYFGALDVYYYFNPEQIASYRSYSDTVILRKKAVTGAVPKPEAAPGYEIPVEAPNESQPLPWFKREGGEPGSTIAQEPNLANPKEEPLIFVKDYVISNANVVLGPHPLQLRFVRQLIVLPETIPWLFVIFFVGKGIVTSKKRLHELLPLLLVVVGIILLVALFLNAYGTYMRVRIPAFLLLMSVAALGLQTFKKPSWMAR